MSSPDKLPLAVKALKVLVNNLQPKDTVSVVTYAGNTAKVLDPTMATNRGAIFEALDSLGAGGGTGMEDGMKTAYDLAIRQKKSGGTSRVIVLSDGDANIGRASHDDILKQIEAYVKEGVTMTTIGLGSGNYNEQMMEQLANKGNGNYYYIDSLAEARKVFGEQVDGTLQVIAKDVKLQVEFDPAKVKRYRLIGYENRDIADRDFRNDAVDAGELGAGHTVTALYELELNGAPEEKLGVVRVRHKKPDAIKAVEDAFPFGAANFKKKVNDGSTDFQFAASVATFAEILRGSPHTKSVNFDWVLEIAQPAAQGREDRLGFVELVKKAKALK
jgi:Ca-activated chloride channel family protein